MCVKSHKPKGNKKELWDSAEANFSDNNDSLEIFGNPVMESWEEPYMEELANIATMNNGKVLEIGCGAGYMGELLSNHCNYYGMDYSSTLIIKHYQLNNKVLCCEANDLPFKANYFGNSFNTRNGLI